MAGLGYFTQRAHKVGLTEQFAGLDAQLAAHNLLIKTIIAIDYYVVDTGLGAFHNAHFQRNTITVNIFFDRYELEEEISVVHVQRVDCIIISTQSLVHVLLVVDISGLHTKDAVEYSIGIHCIAYPIDILDVVFFAFVNIDIDVYKFFVIRHNAITHDDSITITFFVIFFDNTIEVIAVVLLDEFLLAEEVDQLILLVGFFHGTLYLIGGQHTVAGNVDFVYLDLATLIH